MLALTGGSAAAAEDVVAEAFARAQVEWDRVQAYDRPDLWLRRVAVNLAISRHRRDGRVDYVGLDPFAGSAPTEVSPMAFETLEALRSLPERQAQVVALVFFGREPVTEAARILEISESTARTHLKRALEQLATRLSTEEVDDGCEAR